MIWTRGALNVMKNSPFLAKVVSTEPLEHGKWIALRKIHYTDPNGKARLWEMAVRTTRTDTTNLDAVTILPLLKPSKQDKPTHIALIKQFRPPCGRVMVEMPAGLIDPKQSVEMTAERELSEETGYVGTTVASSHDDVVLYGDPGMTNANHALTTIEIDMSDSRNEAPAPHLEDSEFIQVFTLPLAGLLQSLVKLCQAEGSGIDGRLYHFAYGLELAGMGK